MRAVGMLRITCLLGAAIILSACGGGGGSSGNSGDAGHASPALSQTARLGKLMFEDTALSASGKQSCGTCHKATSGFTDPDQTPVSKGGPDMTLTGLRNAPTLFYANAVPSFHFEADGTPVGGQFRDGRVNSLAEQAALPFTNSFEMANSSAEEVVDRLKTRPYLNEFTALYGADVLADADQTLRLMANAIATYENEDEEFHSFSSKFDAWTKGETQLSAQELNGLRLFNDPSKGNCAACHPSTPANGLPAMFTDFTYDNLGVPRNTDIEANNDHTSLSYVPYNGDGNHSYYDLGLCGPLRDDLSGNTTLCGAFRVPTLRNAALTAPYFHNGKFATLQDALRFYVRRDTNPEEFYPVKADGSIEKFDDLPEMFRVNVNVTEAPYNRLPGQEPALSESEITDVVAFICTLTDGYDSKNAANYVLPAQCPQAN